MKIVIAGGSGFVGRALTQFATTLGHEVVVLTRRPTRANEVAWDGETRGDWQRELNRADAVVNLSGRSVDCRHTAANRDAIVASRVNSTAVIRDAVAACTHPPPVVVQAGAVGIFGDCMTPCDEDAPHGNTFLATVCEQWETAFFAQGWPGTRLCMLRIAMVLGPGGGPLAPLRRLTKLFLGGTVGHGRQIVSWIHIHDLCRIMMVCIDDERMNGRYNATSPEPVSNRIFMQAMRRALNRPWCPPAPAFAVRLGARFVLQTEASLALDSVHCVPRRLQDEGFEFDFPEIDTALTDVFSSWPD